MSFQDNLIEVTNIEVLRRVLEPLDDNIPDPEIDFDACVDAVVKQTRRTVLPMSHAKRHAYFMNKARNSMEWCRRINAPAEISERVEQWLERLERQWPS